MRSGWSLYQYEGQWYKHDFAEAILSDNKLAIDIPVEEGDTVTVTAADVVVLPAASRATAVSVWLPFVAVVVFHDTL